MEIVRLQGQVDLARLLQSLTKADPGSGIASTSWMLDLSQAQLDLSINEVARLAMTVGEYRKSSACAESACKVAVLVDNDSSYGVGRMLQAYADVGHIDLRVTRSMDEAEQFLATCM